MASIETGRKSRAGTPLPEIPDKLYFRIGEVARLLALPTYVLRFWETEFPHLKPGKGSTGQRLYRRRDLDTLLEIRHLLYDQGYTIPGARQSLKDRVRTVDSAAVTGSLSETRSLTEAAAETQTAGKLAEPEIDRADSTDAVAVLLNLRDELREIVGLLAQPATGMSPDHSAHRGLHLTPRRRSGADDLPTLFAMRPDEDKPE